VENSNPEIDCSSEPVIRVHLPERRAQLRVCPPALSAILHSGGDQHVVYVGDISYTGAKIRNAPPGLTAGSTIRLATCLPDRDVITVVCTVAYVNGNEAQSEIGVRFEGTGDEDTRALISYLCELLGSQLEIADQILAI
jgi:hypothetical protein